MGVGRGGLTLRTRSPNRGRVGALSQSERPRHGGWTHVVESPEVPGRFARWGCHISDGFRVCLRARTTDQVRDFYTTATALGATSDGDPGFRPEYSNRYHAAFIRDPDVNGTEVVTFVE